MAPTAGGMMTGSSVANTDSLPSGAIFRICPRGARVTKRFPTLSTAMPSGNSPIAGSYSTTVSNCPKGRGLAVATSEPSENKREIHSPMRGQAVRLLTTDIMILLFGYLKPGYGVQTNVTSPPSSRPTILVRQTRPTNDVLGTVVSTWVRHEWVSRGHVCYGCHMGAHCA